MATYTPRFPGSGTIIEEAFIEGEARGEAKAIIRVLEVRGIEVPDAARERVASCTDLEMLGTWLDRSLTASTAEELFDES
ncbi:hypothetical protein [Streptomyces sp. NPDC088812]|uniref:hypothetical protein n=1 Tax=Streptomyces sp. NPDC088812 TaxID=3365905 RepID=UPI0038220B26